MILRKNFDICCLLLHVKSGANSTKIWLNWGYRFNLDVSALFVLNSLVCCKRPPGSLNSHILFSSPVVRIWMMDRRSLTAANTKQHNYRQNDSLKRGETRNTTQMWMEEMFEGLTCKCLYGYRLLTGAFWGGVCCCIYLHSCLYEFMHNEGRIKEKGGKKFNEIRREEKGSMQVCNAVMCLSEFVFNIAARMPKSSKGDNWIETFLLKQDGKQRGWKQ